MTLIARKFHSQPQWNAVVGQCLSSIASATVRHLGATLVMVFGQVTDPQQFLWLGDRGDEDELARLALPPSLGDSLAQGLVGSTLHVASRVSRLPSTAVPGLESRGPFACERPGRGSGCLVRRFEHDTARPSHPCPLALSSSRAVGDD